MSKRINTKYSDDDLAKIAKKYNTRKDFLLNDNKAYQLAHVRGIFESITAHMPERAFYWTKERCAEVANSCKTRGEFRKKAIGAYRSAWKNNWLEELCAHMPKKAKKEKKEVNK